MAKKMWGGRFKKEIDKDFFQFQKSIHFDYKLAEPDAWHSFVHILALKKAGILTAGEKTKLLSALKEILKEIEEKKFKPSLESEDIHTEIQNRMESKIGKLAFKLHTLRSRNDQVVFDEKFYCKREIKEITSILNSVISALGILGNKHKDYYIAGYTHTQRAQKISFKNYLDAYKCMLARDKERLLNFGKNLKIYIGSGAFKGTSLTKEYEGAIKDFLKFYKDAEIFTVKNAPDNVSDRDFIIEFLSSMAILQMHLSRLAEDFILYSTKEFNYFELPEEFCTGSSLMPHKKNPDFLELVRGYTGRIYGNLIALLVTMKGLPLTYNRDMQLDKEPLFSSVELIKDELKILAKFIKGIKLNEKVIEKALEDESLYATDLAEYLVRKKIPFSQAHEIIGKLIRYAEDEHCKIKDMDDNLLKKFSSYLSREAIERIFAV